MDLINAKIHALGDLELAVLLCFVAEQHCIITTANHLLGDLAEELRLIAANTFGLSCALVNCSASTTLDDFKESVLVDAPDEADDSEKGSVHHLSLPSFKHTGSRQTFFRKESGLSNELDDRKIADIVIAKDLNLAESNVQTQALELIRTRRVFSHTAMHGASKNFLFVALQSTDSNSRLSFHLNDLFAISHHHAEEDGFPNLDDQKSQQPAPSDDGASISSVVKHSTIDEDSVTISLVEVQSLRDALPNVLMGAEVAGYLHDIIIFMRLNRYVATGVSASATRHFRAITRALAPLHGLDFVPPSLVALAARKVYAHRIVLATSKTERSMQWGSDIQAVEEALEGVTVEDAIESVLSSVEAPL